MGIWNEDNRLDHFQIMDGDIKRNAGCVAAVCDKNFLRTEKKGRLVLKIKSFGDAFHLCESEPFRNQPIAAGQMATGFLIKEDVIVTAGHVVDGHNLADSRFFFGYKMLNSSTASIQIPDENIYMGANVIQRVITPGNDGSDWALVRLDRKVVGHPLARLSDVDVSLELPVYTIGHPCGLPIKYSPGANVRKIDNAHFSADLSVYPGSSGSPVFSRETHEAVGIVVRGDNRDFRWTGEGWRSIVYPDPELPSRWPQCTKISEIIYDLIPQKKFTTVRFTGYTQNIINYLKSNAPKKLGRDYQFLELKELLKIAPLESNFSSLYLHALIRYSLYAPKVMIRLLTFKKVVKAYEGHTKDWCALLDVAEQLFVQFKELKTEEKMKLADDPKNHYVSAGNFMQELEKFNIWFHYFQNHISNPMEIEHYKEVIRVMEENKKSEEEEELKKVEREYDIALSFAGEDRDYVRKVAQILDNAGIKVFYDEFETASLWGKDLYAHLQKVYRDKAKFTIMFCSQHYAEKAWTNLERRSAQERAFLENSEYILPAKFDDTEIPGLPKTVAYIDLTDMPPYKLCSIIGEKLGVTIPSSP